MVLVSLHDEEETRACFPSAHEDTPRMWYGQAGRRVLTRT